MKTVIRKTLLALATVAVLIPVTAEAQRIRGPYRNDDRYRNRTYDRYDRYGGDWLTADLEKTARQVHRQAQNYYRGGRGEREAINALRALEDTARAFNRSGGDEWAFERLADTYYRAADALSRIPYRSHVYGGFNHIDDLMNQLFDRYGYRSGSYDRYGRDRNGRYPRDRYPRDRWRY
jgi:hypothetical protein